MCGAMVLGDELASEENVEQVIGRTIFINESMYFPI